MATKTITINIDEDVLKRLRSLNTENVKKGFLGKSIEDKESEEATKNLRHILTEGYAMGKVKKYSRDELHER